MKKLLTSSILALSGLFTITACANVGAAADTAPTTTMQQQRGQMQNMISELNLSANQQSQMQALMQSNRGNHMQNHDAMMQILTPEQRQKLMQMRSQHRQQDGHMMNKGSHMNQDGRMNQGGRMDMSQ